MKELILIRGLPGSGKSTLAKLLANYQAPVFCIDDFFTDKITGAYNFIYDKNHLAYKQCEENTKTAMISEAPKIFVDNTFTMDWEIEPYFKLAAEYNYRIHVITVEKYHKGINTHGVSNEQLQKMADKFKVRLL